MSCIHIESLSERTSMTFREEKLEEILGKFTTNGPIEVKPKRRKVPHEKQFRKICQNLKLHLGGTNIQTDIFEGLKAVIQRDFEDDFYLSGASYRCWIRQDSNRSKANPRFL